MVHSPDRGRSNALRQAGLGEALFQEVLGQLEVAGLVLKTGTLIDATLVRSSGRTPASFAEPSPAGEGKWGLLQCNRAA